MKTKELIKQLQEADPTGEYECVVENVDIFSIEPLPGYYDGAYQVIKRDNNFNGFNIIGAKYTCEGIKIQIRTYSIKDFLCDFPDGKVEVERESMLQTIEKWRKKVNEE